MTVAPPPAGAESRDLEPHMFVGSANVRRLSWWKFPVQELVRDGEVLARMGRMGWFRVFIGPGQRVELPDGVCWTVGSIGDRGTIRPLITDSERRKVAIAGLSHGTYGITGKSYGCALYPADKPRFGTASTWVLSQRDDVLAIINRYPLSVEALLPVHLGAVFLSFVLMRYGLPEEAAPRVPAFHWD